MLTKKKKKKRHAHIKKYASNILETDLLFDFATIYFSILTVLYGTESQWYSNSHKSLRFNKAFKGISCLLVGFFLMVK